MTQPHEDYVISIDSDTGFNAANYIVSVDSETGNFQLNTVNTQEYSTIPHFEFQLSHRYHYNGLITVGDEIIHCIIDVNDFYNALGYTDEIRAAELCFDDYLWNEYRKEDSCKTEACLQSRLIEYLIKYSSTFIRKYAHQYESWLKRCNEIAQKFDDCAEWILNPKHDTKNCNCITPSKATFFAANTI